MMHSVITVANVAANAIISSQYTCVFLKRSRVEGMPKQIAHTTPTEMIGTYMICQQATKHHNKEQAAASLAATEWTVLSILQERKAGAAPTKQIDPAAKNDSGCR